jgi:hypothetical protein
VVDREIAERMGGGPGRQRQPSADREGCREEARREEPSHVGERTPGRAEG